MLTVIAYFFILIDVNMSSVDILFDFIGYFLLTLAFLKDAVDRKSSFCWMLPALVCTAADILNLFTLQSVVSVALRFLLPLVLLPFMGRRSMRTACERASEKPNPPDPNQLLYQLALVTTMFVLTVLCELFSALFSYLFELTVLKYILYALRTVLAVPILILLSRLLFRKSY